MLDMKVKTDIITSISAKLIGRVVILVIMFFKTFQNWRYCFYR